MNLEIAENSSVFNKSLLSGHLFFFFSLITLQKNIGYKNIDLRRHYAAALGSFEITPWSLQISLISFVCNFDLCFKSKVGLRY